MTDSKVNLYLRSQRGKKELLKAYNQKQEAESHVKEIKENWVSKIMSKLKKAEVVK